MNLFYYITELDEDKNISWLEMDFQLFHSDRMHSCRRRCDLIINFEYFQETEKSGVKIVSFGRRVKYQSTKFGFMLFKFQLFVVLEEIKNASLTQRPMNVHPDSFQCNLPFATRTLVSRYKVLFVQTYFLPRFFSRSFHISTNHKKSHNMQKIIEEPKSHVQKINGLTAVQWSNYKKINI